eukprot:GILK01004409.1.p1 GENE.GILK01004409.1~~GILK01004409.1.p1  ORF type:complete len:404 (-),score=58.07 GILK01004409.1:274-1485(-)
MELDGDGVFQDMMGGSMDYHSFDIPALSSSSWYGFADDEDTNMETSFPNTLTYENESTFDVDSMFSFGGVNAATYAQNYGQVGFQQTAAQMPVIKMEPQTVTFNIMNSPQPLVRGTSSGYMMNQQMYAPPVMKLKSEVDIRVISHPPAEVRTRTPSELRVFSTCVSLTGDYQSKSIAAIGVSLCYACEPGKEPVPVAGQHILGGPKMAKVADSGMARFDGLSISESSSKHQEKEFCLLFSALSQDGSVVSDVSLRASNPFYCFSHKSVLKRRQNVVVRLVSYSRGSAGSGMEGGAYNIRCHIVGKGFIQGPSLGVTMQTPHGNVKAANVEFFSDSVLFFDLPLYPIPEMANCPEGRVDVNFVVTNDGRFFSEPVRFSYDFVDFKLQFQLSDNNSRNTSIRSRI